MLHDSTGNLCVTLIRGAQNPTAADQSEYAAAQAGGMFIGGSGILSVGIASNLRCTITNPANSGKTMSITRILLYGSFANAQAHLYLNPTAGLPTAVKTATNVNIGGANNAAAIAVIKADSGTTALSGGIDTGVDFGIPNASQIPLNLPPFLLNANNTVGFNIPFTVAANAALVFFWAEQ